jgi:hypothetical protein
MLFIWINPQIIDNARANLSVWHFIGVDIESGTISSYEIAPQRNNSRGKVASNPRVLDQIGTRKN